jgi:hypothetical protein
MGFSFKKFTRIPSLKSAVKGFVYSGGGVLPGIGEVIAGSDPAEGAMNSIMKGAGNLVSGGYISQKEATDEAKKARDLAAKQYAEQQAAVEAETQRLADLDEEKKRRLAAAGTQNPQTLLGGYRGVTGTPTTYRALLGA